MIQILLDPILLSPILAWFLSQGLKNIVFWKKDKKISRKYIFSDGGMPSAHSAVMASLTTVIGFTQGLTPLFYLAFFVSLVIFRDATGVRLQTAKQAKAINLLFQKTDIHEDALKELIGHTRRQVIAGIIVGVFATAVTLALF